MTTRRFVSSEQAIKAYVAEELRPNGQCGHIWQLPPRTGLYACTLDRHHEGEHGCGSAMGGWITPRGRLYS